MRWTTKVQTPVITFLSPSPAASKRAVDRLRLWTTQLSSSRPEMSVDSGPANHNGAPQTQKKSNELEIGSVPFQAETWRCSETGTILQWISPSNAIDSSSNSRKKQAVHHSLLAIQDIRGQTADDALRDTDEAVQHSRVRLQQLLEPTTASTRLRLKLCHWFGRPSITLQHIKRGRIEASTETVEGWEGLREGLRNWLLRQESFTSPILDIDPQPEAWQKQEHQQQLRIPKAKPQRQPGGLKEIVIPFDPEGQGMSLLQELSSRLPSPVTALYEFPSVIAPRSGPEAKKTVSGLCLRPVPAAEADQSLSPPSLVFHFDEQEQGSVLAELAGEDIADEETSIAKIGFSGLGKGGQVMLRHADLAGLDVRLCSNSRYSTVFAEAQESLFAGSLEQLQSVRVNGAPVTSSQRKGTTTGGEQGTLIDPKTNQADCWVEVRANLSRPMGYLKRRKPKTAKAPDLPYE